MKQDIICPGPLTEETLTQAVESFLMEVRPGRERLYDYYRSQQPVPKGEAVRGRPNNLLRIPFPRYITEVHTGYFLGLPPTLDFPRAADGAAYAALSASLGLNHLLFDVGRDMSVCGAGFVLVWLEQTGLHACRCDPLTCFSIRSGAAGAPLLGTVRLFQGPDGETGGILYQSGALRPFTWDGRRAVWAGPPEENLRRSILQLSMTPDLSDDSFAGNTSGVALQYKLWGIEQVRAAKERSFTPGLKALLAALSGGLSTLGTPADLASGRPTFYKNLPQDQAAQAEALLSLAPVLSRRTILEHLPWVADPEEELRRIEKEETNE